MVQIEKFDVENILKTVIDPNHGVDLITSKSVKAINSDGSVVSIIIELG